MTRITLTFPRTPPQGEQHPSLIRHIGRPAVPSVDPPGAGLKSLRPAAVESSRVVYDEVTGPGIDMGAVTA